MRRVFFIIILLFLFITSFVFYTNKAFLYSGIPTHYNLTQEVIKFYNMVYDPDITLKQAELIMKGSVDEDTLPRPAFHLYDPVYNRAPFGVYTAKEWSLNSRAQSSALQKFASILFSIFRGEFAYHGDYSWQASVKYFAKDDLNKAYYGLGHILHLIEDVTVPAHSRNDHHLMGDPYEQWVAKSTNSEDYDWTEKLYYDGYRPVDLYSLSQAFNEAANYSNKYFFSKDTILSDDYKWPEIVKIKKEDFSYWAQRTYAWGNDEDGNLFRLAFVNYRKTNWDRAFHDLSEQTYIYSLDKDDQNLNHGYWERLAPKVITYGAGVIRLFVEQAELEKDRLVNKFPEPSFFQKATTFIKGVFGIKDENKEQEPESIIPPKILPQPKPTRFPVAESIVKPAETPLVEESKDKEKEQAFDSAIGGAEVTGDKAKEGQEESVTHIVINEVFYDPSGTDTGLEYIILYNNGNSPYSLTNHCLYASGEHYIFGSFTLSNGNYVAIHWNADGVNTSTDLYTGKDEWSNMGNTSGTVALFSTHEYHKSSTINDFIQYGRGGETWENTALKAGIWTAGDFIPDVEPGKAIKLIIDGVDNNSSSDWREVEPTIKERDIRIVKGPKTGGGGGSSPPDQTQETQQQEQEQEEGQQEEEQEEEEQSVSHFVINEIQIRDNEFVELYNPTDSDISLASYSFCYYSSARDWNDPRRNKTFPETASISAKGYYLIGILDFPESDGNPDADWQIKTDEGNPYSSGELSNTDGSIGIFPWDPSERTASEANDGAIDAVAWGDVENVLEGTAFQETIGIDKSIQRKAIAQDTDDNNTDFEYKKIPSPTNSNGETRIPGTIIPDDTVYSDDYTWTIAGSPYYIELNANQWPIVKQGATLTIEPGVVIMPMGGNYTFLEIRGTLIAEGTNDDKIVFTSIKDSDYGGTGGAAAGDWVRLLFTSTSMNSSIKNAIFRYGSQKVGLQYLDTEMVKVDGNSITMENIIMEHGKSRGLHLIDSNSKIENSSFKDSKIGVLIEGSSNASTIDNCSFEDNKELGIEIKNSASPNVKNSQFSDNGEVVGASDQGAVMLHSAYPEFENNQVSNNITNGILVHWNSNFSQDTTWQADLPYVLVSNAGEYPTVASGSTLILEPNTIIKPFGANYTNLLVEGTLLAEAATDSEIVFTSFKDDTYGGDTNNDGNATIPVNGDWEEIRFTASSQGSILDHVFMYYGAGTPPFIVDHGGSVEERDVDYEP